jgi:hypothetical protein
MRTWTPEYSNNFLKFYYVTSLESRQYPDGTWHTLHPFAFVSTVFLPSRIRFPDGGIHAQQAEILVEH